MSATRSKQDARQAYNRLSAWYDLLAAPSERKARELGLRLLDVHEGEVVLEVGSGTGHAVVSLARCVAPHGRVCAVDISEGMILRTRSRARQHGVDQLASFFLGDGARLPLKPDGIDAVFVSFTLELFDTPEIPMVLQECRRVLHPGGRISVVALGKRDQDGLVAHAYEWAHRRFPSLIDCRPIFTGRELEASGFLVVQAHSLSMWGLPVDVVLARRE